MDDFLLWALAVVFLVVAVVSLLYVIKLSLEIRITRKKIDEDLKKCEEERNDTGIH